MEDYVVIEDGKFFINKEGDHVETATTARIFNEKTASRYIEMQQSYRDWAKAPHRNLEAKKVGQLG